MSEVKQRALQARRELELVEGALGAIKAAAIERMIEADLVVGDAVRARMAAIAQTTDEIRHLLNSYIDSETIEDFADTVRETIR